MKHILLGPRAAADICPQNSNGPNSEYSRIVQNTPPYQRIALKSWLPYLMVILESEFYTIFGCYLLIPRN